MKTVSLELSKQLKEELWLPIKRFEGLYEVSSFGNVRSVKTGRILKPQLRRRYYSVSLSKDNSWKSYPIHRLVAIVFLPNPKRYPEVNHKDSNQLNNNVTNLEWCSKSYNKIHSYKVGTSKPTKGILNGMHRINRERRLWKNT